jgi:hypothetical protein
VAEHVEITTEIKGVAEVTVLTTVVSWFTGFLYFVLYFDP